ncbi:hypothetical protein KY290_027444 [Solanum tuberosum]|uniref:Integrase core domain containing protein n=1 Tax=Solanum tuberosum TaxID=4113 RepID=A0ABQ7UF51_SOLTU|nr:hypothetical protein KY290_027444 [Solanum tuberosum]
MVGYPINVGRIIATEMRDRALNERAGLPFPLIGKLCRQANIPPNRLVNRWGEAFRLTQVSRIKNFANHLFGVKSAAVGTFVVVPYVPIDIPYADRGPEQGESSQPYTGEPPSPASASQAPSTYAAGSVDIEEFKSQLAEMRTQVAKLAAQPVQVPTLVMPDSLMQLLNQAPSTQSLDDVWGELPMSKSGKRKHRAEESDEETHADLSREKKRQEKKARKASRKEAREK